MINRVVVSSRRPVQTEYHITEKGRMIELVLEVIAEFSMTAVLFEDGKLQDIDGLFGKNV